MELRAQGHGLGWRLLRDAILRTLQVAEHVGVRALLAHALDQRAAGFYARYDCQPSPADPLHMLLLLKDARADPYSRAGPATDVNRHARSSSRRWPDHPA